MMQEEPKYNKRDKMDPNKRNKWETQQNYIRSLITEKDIDKFNVEEVNLVAGVDVSFSGKFENGACAGLLIYDIKKRKIVYEDFMYVVLKQEYIPGFLAFRELPPTLQLFNRLKKNQPKLWPQVILVDGNGIVHKKKCGYACHLGVILKTPSIGCAKTFFDIDGLHQWEVEENLSNNLKYHGDEAIIIGKSGKQWCTGILADQNQNKHLYVSVGTMISLDSATKLAKKMLKYETPEPVRLVDRISRKMIRNMKIQDYESAKSYEMIFLSESHT